MDNSDGRCYENFGRNFTFCGYQRPRPLAILIIFFSNFLLKTVNTADRNYADTLVDNAVSDLNTAIAKGDSEAYSKSVVGNDGAGGLMRLR